MKSGCFQEMRRIVVLRDLSQRVLRFWGWKRNSWDGEDCAGVYCFNGRRWVRGKVWWICCVLGNGVKFFYLLGLCWFLWENGISDSFLLGQNSRFVTTVMFVVLCKVLYQGDRFNNFKFNGDNCSNSRMHLW